MGGSRCIRGMRMTSVVIVNLLAAGYSAEIVHEYSDLVVEDVEAAAKYAVVHPDEVQTDADEQLLEEYVAQLGGFI